jgi:hypothetical protein
MQKGARYHGLAGGEGAHLLSRALCFALRGLNESYPFWGAHEMDLARRAAQRVPQLRASLAGVYCYDFQQRPQLRVGMRVNEDVDSLEPIVNDDDWGLWKEDIPRIPAEPCPQVDNIGIPPAPYDIPIQKWTYGGVKTFIYRFIACLFLDPCVGFLQKALLEKLLNSVPQRIRRGRGLLFRAAFKTLSNRWLAERNLGVDSLWYCGDWYGESGKLKIFFGHALEVRFDSRSSESLSSICFFLAVLATVGRRRPVRFFHAAGRDMHVAQAAAFVDPTLEITSYDHWQGVGYSSNSISGAMSAIGFEGYYHLESGPMETALARLRSTPFAGEPYDCLALDLDFLQPIEKQLHSELAPLLADSCAVILCGGSEKRNELGAVLLERGFNLVALLHGTSVYVRSC